jgi:hypothetical protein
MSSYPVKRGNAHLGLFTQAEVSSLLSSGKLMATDEVMLSAGKWVAVSSPEFRSVAPVAPPAKLPPPLPTKTVATAQVAASAAIVPLVNPKTRSIALRVLLAFSVLFAVLSVVLDQSLGHVLPAQLREWRELNQDFSESWLFIIPCLVSMTCWLVGVGGAWFYKRWGAYLMLCSTVVITVLNSLTPNVTPGVAGLFADAGLLIEGAALGLMFFGDALE